jgi:hypothetical protein
VLTRQSPALFVLEFMTIALMYVPQIETIIAWSGIGELLSIVLWLSSQEDSREMLILGTQDRVVQATTGISRIRADDKWRGISRILEYSTDFE